jgi:hypothetical protein
MAMHYLNPGKISPTSVVTCRYQKAISLEPPGWVQRVQFFTTYRRDSSESQVAGPIWAILGRCGVVIVSHKQQPERVGHTSMDQSIEGTEQ